jgi:hypothetical protein
MTGGTTTPKPITIDEAIQWMRQGVSVGNDDPWAQLSAVVLRELEDLYAMRLRACSANRGHPSLNQDEDWGWRLCGRYILMGEQPTDD